MSRSELMIQYFNKVAGARALEINDIPLDVTLFLNTLSNYELAKSFIIQDLENGNSLRQIIRKYPVSFQQVRTLKAQCVNLNTQSTTAH